MPSPHPPNPMAVREIALITLSNVGDCLLTLPVLAALDKQFPKSAITVVCGPRGKVVFARDPRAAAVMIYDKRAALREKLQLIRLLRRRRFDVLVDLRHSLFPWLLRSRRHTQPWDRPSRGIVHHQDRHLWQLERLVGSVPPVAPEERLWLDPHDELFARQYAAPFVLISPAARSDNKRWPAERFAGVADRLIAQHQAQVVFTGEPDEQRVAETIRRAMRHPAQWLMGQTTLGQLISLVRRAQCVITNDSATLHIASLLERPVVALFGPTDPQEYGPRHAASQTLRHADGLQAVTVEDVLAAVRAFVPRTERAGAAR